MDFKRLKELVVSEARGLKANATKEEINNLDLLKLNPISYTDCIYGQMTGSCHSSRARYLLEKSATPIARAVGGAEMPRWREFKPSKFTEESFGGRDYFSALEVYISLTEVEWGIRNIVGYLQGVKETLTVNDL